MRSLFDSPTFAPAEFGPTYSWPTAEQMAAPVPGIEAVLFDFSNTIFHLIEADLWLQQVAASTGRELADATAAVTALENALARPDVASAQIGRDTHATSHRKAMHTWFSAVDFLRGHEDIAYKIMIDDDSWQPYPDTGPVLRELRDRGIPCGIVSDFGWDLRTYLARHNMTDLFGAIALSYEVGYEKPHPRIFLSACADLGVDPRRTLMVGDNPTRDGGATAVGMRVLLLPSEHRTGERGLSALLPLLDHESED